MIVERVDHGITKWSKILSLILVGWFASSWWHATLTAEHAKQALPAIEAKANCEKHRGDKAVGLALSPEIIPKSQLPKPCPSVPVPKIP